MSQEIEIVADDQNRTGEGPIWEAARRRMLWTDIEGALVYEYFPETGVKNVISRELSVGGIALNRTGELVFAGATGLHLWRSQDDFRTVATEYEGEPLFFNDMIAGPHGGVYAGTTHWGDDGMEQYGRLYLFGVDGAIRIVEEGIELANGLGFSPDDRTLYFTDSTARRIYAYDHDLHTGALSNRRTFVQIPTDEGLPDGMTVDAEGFVWSAQWYGSQVVRYDPDGKVERRIAMPVQQVSSVAFGGPDRTDLYITSAGDSWRSDYAPPGYDFDAPNIGGAFFRIHGDIAGHPEHLAALT